MAIESLDTEKTADEIADEMNTVLNAVGNISISYDDAGHQIDVSTSGRNQSQVESIIDTVLSNGVSGVGRFTMAANIVPDSDGSRQVGESSNRFSALHAVDVYGTIHYADINFQELRCEICNEKFQEGDHLELIVTRVVDEGIDEDGTYAVPIHSDCKEG